MNEKSEQPIQTEKEKLSVDWMKNDWSISRSYSQELLVSRIYNPAGFTTTHTFYSLKYYNDEICRTTKILFCWWSNNLFNSSEYEFIWLLRGGNNLFTMYDYLLRATIQNEIIFFSTTTQLTRILQKTKRSLWDEAPFFSYMWNIQQHNTK